MLSLLFRDFCFILFGTLEIDLMNLLKSIRITQEFVECLLLWCFNSCILHRAASTLIHGPLDVSKTFDISVLIDPFNQPV